MKMNRKLSWLTLVGLLLIPFTAQSADQILQVRTPAKPAYVENEVLVRFKSGVGGLQQQQIVSALGSSSLHAIGRQQRFKRIKLAQGQSVQQAITAYQADPDVEYVQPNYIYRATAIPNDSNYNQLWGLQNLGQPINNPEYSTNNPGTAGSDIDAVLAWNEITDCSSVVVAVLDTGIDYNHQDLVGNMWVNNLDTPGNGIDDDSNGYTDDNRGWDFIGLDNDPVPQTGGEHHGTHVAGTIGAAGNNANGITGVCWQAQIMPVRVLGEAGGTTASVVMGIEYASDNGAKVINMSLGGEGFDPAFNDAITYAQTNDVVVVVAAGNGGADGVGDNNDASQHYPCNFTQLNLVCVAALDQSYQLTDFSNYGSSSVDVGAPGANILSTIPGRQLVDSFSSGWTPVTGNIGWTTGLCDYGSGPVNMLMNPSDWCPPLSTYTANVDDRIYKIFDLSGADAASVLYVAFRDTEPGSDYFWTGFDSAGNDPFNGVNDTLLQSISGSTLPYADLFTHDLAGCLTATCGIGFRLTTDGSVQYSGSGIGIPYFIVNTLELSANYHAVFNGTSMASPHVAGIATMIRAYNPDFTYGDTVAAIKGGGESIPSLSGITSSGMAANAMGSLAYINPPTGVTAVAP